MSDLAIWLLGPPRIEHEGTLIEIGRRKAMALLAYLAMTRQSYHRDELATLLWPASNQSRARGNLRHVLSELNQAFDLSWLELEGETVGLKQAVEFWLDVDHFRRRLAACQTHGHPIEDVCPACLPPLTEAVALYHNDFLTGFTLRNSPAFDEWQFFQAENLRQELASVLERLVRGHSTQEQFEPAIEYARRWLVLDPLHESVHRHLMQLYARSDQQSAALRQYHECVRVLEEELGVPPHAETTILYQHLRAREIAPVESLSVTPLPPRSSAPRHNLPTSLTPFIGRVTELDKIKEHLQNPACRLLTLVGPGGIGKTRLALEASATQLNHFTHGVYFVSLAPLQTVEAIVPAVAKALNFSFYEKEKPQQQLLDYLRRKSILLIMDNFEHLLTPSQEGAKEAVGLIVDMLQATPDLKILVTSRARLNVKGEQLFHIEEMDFPDEGALENAIEYSAIQLFLQSANRVQPDFNLTADNLTDVIQICRLAAGMPLAILLAAAWVEMLTPTEIAVEIKQSIDLLATDWHDLPERQRSLRAVFDHSWRLLTEPERGVFQRLSVFRGGFTREAAQAVTGASLHQLMALVNKSLIHRTSKSRYGMHEQLRQYAAEKLEASREADIARDAHCAYYVRFLYQREADLKGQRQLGAMDEIDAEFENARVAWNRALEQKNYSAIKQLLRSLGWYCTYRSRDQEIEELLRQAQEQLAPDCGDEPHPIWTRILVARFYANPNSIDRGQIETSLTIAQRHSDREMMGYSLRTLGEIALNHDDYVNALSCIEKSLTHFRALNDSFNITATLSRLAETYRLLGQPEEAIKFARQSLDQSREIGDKFWAAGSLANTGVIALYTGNYTEAEDHLKEANTIYREMGYKTGIASSRVDLSKLAFLSKDFEVAKVLAEEALKIATDIGNKRIARSARDLGSTLAAALGEETDDHPDEQEIAPSTDIPPTIDRFQVKELLGAGSLGTVYLAHDPDTGRDVAIKVANPEALGKLDWFSRMFSREAEMLAKLAHPAITQYYGYGQTVERSYIVLEYIDGKDLEEMLLEYEGFLPGKMVIEWAIQICDILTYLHSQRSELLMLRDLKPSNVMVDRNGKVHLIDFDIVEPYRPGRELPLLGTEGYSPPEQYIGYSDARSDIYALGVTLHQLLTRRDPRKEKPFSHYDVPPRSLNPAISEDLETVILKAVEFKAEDRYQSAAEMKAALLACRL